MKTVSAFAPGNISCVFKIHPNQDPRFAGSSGIGFTIGKGVTVEVERSAITEVIFNDKPMHFPTVEKVLLMLTSVTLRIEIKTELPLGSGFGLSGASALATAYAVNTLLDLRIAEKDLAIIAHTADAAQKTGLGDVANQFFGGFLVKFVKSSEFLVEQLVLTNIPVYCKVFSKLPTDKVLSNNSLMLTINQAADTALLKMQKMLDQKKLLTFEDVINVSVEFANRSGLLQDEKVITTLNAIKKKGGSASMIMLGNAVFSNIPFSGSQKYIITQIGAHLL